MDGVTGASMSGRLLLWAESGDKGRLTVEMEVG